MEEAINVINTHGSSHTDAIITEDGENNNVELISPFFNSLTATLTQFKRT